MQAHTEWLIPGARRFGYGASPGCNRNGDVELNAELTKNSEGGMRRGSPGRGRIRRGRIAIPEDHAVEGTEYRHAQIRAGGHGWDRAGVQEQETTAGQIAPRMGMLCGATRMTGFDRSAFRGGANAHWTQEQKRRKHEGKPGCGCGSHVHILPESNMHVKVQTAGAARTALNHRLGVGAQPAG